MKTAQCMQKARVCELNGLCHWVARTIFSLSNSLLHHAPHRSKVDYHLLSIRWLSHQAPRGDEEKRKRVHASSRRRCSWIRKLLNRRGRRAALRGASFVFIWAGPPWSSPRGQLIEKGASEMRLLAAIIIYYSQLLESWEPFVFISVNSNYVCD